VLSLKPATTDFKTGESYDVAIRLDHAADVWVADLELHFDSELVHVVGTSGHPIREGELFDRSASVIVRYTASEGRVTFTISMLAPASPVTGSGVVGSFRLYPLAPGTTRIRFAQAALTRAVFGDRKGRRVGTGSQSLPVTFTPLDLTITGRRFAPPDDPPDPPDPHI
jgi:hypothetical protein